MIEEVADKTFRLEPSVPGVGVILATYVIASSEGILIDPGPDAAIPLILDGLRRLGVERLAYIVPSHLHMDHAGGSGRLAQAFPDAVVLAHPLAAKHLKDPSRLIESTRFTYGDSFEGSYGPILAVPAAQVRPVEDGDTIVLSDRELRIVHAPGHAPHHIAVLDRVTGCLFCGEALGMPTSSPLPAAAYPSFDPSECIDTMLKLKHLKPSILCYSHGGIARNPEERISAAIEATTAFGEMIRESMSKGLDLSAIGHQIHALSSPYLPSEWGEEMVRVWLTGILHGYTLYFAERGAG